MIKLKSYASSKVGLAMLLAAVSIYAILVVPKVFDTGRSTTLVFEETVIEVKAAPAAAVKIAVKPKTIAVGKTLPKAVPMPLPVTPPNVLYKIAPAYPGQARLQGIEGAVVVKALISERGELLQAQVKRSSGSGILDSSALSSLNNWKFSPAKQGAVSVRSWLEIPFRFALK